MFAELKTVLLSPAVSNARKRGVVNRLAASVPLSKLVRNFLYVLIDRRRADLLKDIAPAFDAAVDERQGVVRAEVKSAVPLGEDSDRNWNRLSPRLWGRRFAVNFRSTNH